VILLSFIIIKSNDAGTCVFSGLSFCLSDKMLMQNLKNEVRRSEVRCKRCLVVESRTGQPRLSNYKTGSETKTPVLVRLRCVIIFKDELGGIEMLLKEEPSIVNWAAKADGVPHFVK